MIFVCLGTQDKSFLRLLKKIDELIDKKIIKEKVIAQAGYTKYNSNNIEVHDYLPVDEFKKTIEDASFLIVHGGVGSILDGIKNNKKVIAVARRKKYDEHENDHQVQIIDNFREEGYILGINDADDLENAIKYLDSFNPKKFKSNNDNFIKNIDDYLMRML